ncbi:MAG: hypothetical protein ACJ8E3_08180 [Sphingomicrobium sp.]
MPIVVEAAPAFEWLNAWIGLAGVLLGGLLTYLVTYQFERRRTKNERLGRAYSLMFAIIKLSDDLTKMEQDVQSGIAKAEAAGVHGELWAKMPINIGHSDPVSVAAEDLTVVALTRDTDLTTQIGEVEAAHRIYTQCFRRLDELRIEFRSFGLETAVEGETVSFEADHAQLVKIAPTLIQLRTLSDAVATGLPDAAKQARDVAERLGPHLKKFYKFKHFLVLSFPAPTVPAAPAKTEASA